MEDCGSAIHLAPGSTFCMEDFLLSSLAANLMDATADTGPVDDAGRSEGDNEYQEESIAQAYDAFFGTSPLSTAPPTPASSRPLSPELQTWNPPRSNKRKHQPSTPPSTQQFHLPESIHDEIDLKLKSTSKSRRDKIKSKAARQKKRHANPDKTRPSAAHTLKKHIAPSQEYSTSYDVADIPSALTGFVAKPDEKGRVYELPELLSMGFRLIKWDGRTSTPILDKNGLVVAVLVGAPDASDWDKVCDSAYDLLCTKAPLLKFTKKTADHRRGQFPAVNVGISFGGGQMAPGNLCHTNAQAEILDDILTSKAFERMAGFASQSFAAWMPQLHGYYKRDFDKLLDRHRRLKRNFENGVWAAAAINFGPKTITAKHRDAANLPFGVCSITALGKFDPTKGGHVALWELGLVVEFPPGSTVLIPSAAVSHSNTPISRKEHRASFTQYSAGGLFRWVQHGFQTEYNFNGGMADEERATVAADNRARCKLGLSLFPKLSDLRSLSKKAPAPPKA